MSLISEESLGISFGNLKATWDDKQERRVILFI